MSKGSSGAAESTKCGFANGAGELKRQRSVALQDAQKNL